MKLVTIVPWLWAILLVGLIAIAWRSTARAFERAYLDTGCGQNCDKLWERVFEIERGCLRHRLRYDGLEQTVEDGVSR